MDTNTIRIIAIVLILGAVILILKYVLEFIARNLKAILLIVLLVGGAFGYLQISGHTIVSGMGIKNTCHPNGYYDVVGCPSISESLITSVLVNAGSPAANEGHTLYQGGVDSGIDPAFALAFFKHESSFGLYGMAHATHSLGNIRCAGYKPCYQGFRMYRNWYDGIRSWYSLLKDVYLVRGLSRIDQIIPVYAPSSDNNNVAGYIAAIKGSVDTWRSQSKS